MATWEDLLAMASHMLAGTWAKTAGAMRPSMSVHTSLTSVVAQTMGRQFPGCAQSPFLWRGWTRLAHSGGMRVAIDETCQVPTVQ